MDSEFSIPVVINGKEFQPRALSYEEILEARAKGFDVWAAVHSAQIHDLEGLGKGQETVLSIVFPNEEDQNSLKKAKWIYTKELYERIFFSTIELPDDLKN